jgi:hypothetical protein
MHMQLNPFVLAAALSLATVATAQEVDAPALAPDAVLRLQILELRAENIALKQAQLQSEFALLQAEANAYAQTLRRDGYTLARGQDGVWRYTAAPKAPTP